MNLGANLSTVMELALVIAAVWLTMMLLAKK